MEHEDERVVFGIDLGVTSKRIVGSKIIEDQPHHPIKERLTEQQLVRPIDEAYPLSLYPLPDDPLVAASHQEVKRRFYSYLGPGILVFEDIAWVTPSRFEKLDVYDASVPTGVYYGKCWKREDMLGMYLTADPPDAGYYATGFVPIQVVPQRMIDLDPCSACNHPKLAHEIPSAQRPCQVLRCVCERFQP